MAIATEAVVIGGGVMGASILYNLAARGVSGPVLLERDTLGRVRRGVRRARFGCTIRRR